jgi:hypothetical protein
VGPLARRVRVRGYRGHACPGVDEQAWAEGFATALHSPAGRTWRQHLDSWRQGNELAHEIAFRRRAHRFDGHRFTLCCPVPLPDPGGLADVAADVAAERLEHSGAERAKLAYEQARQASASAGGHWRQVRRIMAALAVMATAAVAASDQRVTALAPAVATRRMVVAGARHAAPESRTGRRRPDRPRTTPRHRRPGWRTLAGRWLRDAVRPRGGGAHRAARGPLRAAA